MAKKVLVVDDEKLIVKGIRFSLEQDGMEVDCAYDGEEALDKIKNNKYDLILLDIMLPDMDGLEVLGLWVQGTPDQITALLDEELVRSVGNYDARIQLWT